MVLDAYVASAWKLVRVCPFGCVLKADADPRFEESVIHDLSFPRGASVNDASDAADLPPLSHEHVDATARRIEWIKSRNPCAAVRAEHGDVKSAFWNVFGHSSVCSMFSGMLSRHGALEMDLVLPFEWTGPLGHYGMFGCATTFLARRKRPSNLAPDDPDTEPLYCYTWVDNHVPIEEDRDERLVLCEVALRLAMLAILGPRSINEKKFTSWSTHARALGLDRDTVNRTVSMWQNKIEKALTWVRALPLSKKVSKTSLSQLLGSLRHVCSCVRSARPFFQRLAALQRRSLRWIQLTLSKDAHLDLLWMSTFSFMADFKVYPFAFSTVSQNQLCTSTGTSVTRGCAHCTQRNGSSCG
ncbi:hypothetical protein PC129_g23131 [Phytophthora cactorum]|uniref:Uncharacterized protein n=1 Tax=Phytophthora cactorum TaxID=29920 RepID=A0A329RC46_9STRA|nr:hypothetical protein Pcac1_g5689 [Phytophthora cactorum]KAG2873840.1 hypothetical protein PC114_g25631 [Phytophthora cactorum]KAG2880993.1 hypothetical protein PC115_g22350 [Phytophthora cactorum]KAG3049505.1 hypothetical protein PC122_g23538 [Phytophthora cactorum]KAG3202849.1 hypothetical protein PC129_g23131 [Phytophthora cactorum]